MLRYKLRYKLAIRSTGVTLEGCIFQRVGAPTEKVPTIIPGASQLCVLIKLGIYFLEMVTLRASDMCSRHNAMTNLRWNSGQ